MPRYCDLHADGPGHPHRLSQVREHCGRQPPDSQPDGNRDDGTGSTTLVGFGTKIGSQCVSDSIRDALLKVDHTEQTMLVSARPRGEEKLVLLSVDRFPATESQPPQTLDADYFSASVFQLPHVCPGGRIEDVDAAINQVPNQNGSARRTKVGRRQDQAPWPVEGAVGCESLDHIPCGIKNIHHAAGLSTESKSYEQLTIDVLDIKRAGARRQTRVGKGTHQIERPIVDVHFVVLVIGRVDEVGAVVHTDRQACIVRTVTLGGNHSGVSVY